MDETKIIKSINISEKTINNTDLAAIIIKKIENELEAICENTNWVKIKNKMLYYVVSEKIIIADSRRWSCSLNGYNKDMDGIVGGGYELYDALAKRLFYEQKGSNPLMSGDYIINADNSSRNYVACTFSGSGYAMCCDNGNRTDWGYGDTDTIKIPYISVRGQKYIISFIQYGMIPDGTKYESQYEFLFKWYEEGKIAVDFENNNITYDIDELGETDEYKQLVENISYNYDTSNLKNKLIMSDKLRADIEEYDPTVLTDIGVGHWDLWEMADSDGVEIPLDEPLVARDPAADILDDGIIGIDFGTKSTVVGYQNGTENIHLLRIGKGDLRSRASYDDYENPTMIEFDDIASFLKDYKAKCGRPETSWADVKVSHTANYNFNNNTSREDSENFYSFFYNLKQWCGRVNQNRSEKIRSMRTGEEFTLPKYVELGENDLDPIEIYAYYLGLYINNMRNKIYLRYIMSFPVTYEKRIREKILDSFRKGLKKSLPQCILENEDIMKRFEVAEGAAEPASYAVCALTEYRIEPPEDKSALYGVFDFGGGTTDFDFGLWRIADEDSIEEERYDYVIEHFGAGGAKYLGGENLLELLAFEIFKANRDTLLEKHITFTKPVYVDNFDEMEDLVANTQIANRNTKQLAEALRPFIEKSMREIGEVILNSDSAYGLDKEVVEKIVGYFQQTSMEFRNYGELSSVISELQDKGIIDSNVSNAYIAAVAEVLGIERPDPNESDESVVNEVVSDFEPLKSGSIKVGLFKADGEYMADTELLLKQDGKVIVDLLGILTEKIDDGMKNFCQAFRQAVSTPAFKAKNASVGSIYIFLAGNSSKSPIVKNLFVKYMNESFPDLCKSFGVDPVNDLYLMPPLGSAQADELMKKLNIDTDFASLTRPTGKTGVVYGLIESRKGGTILVKNNNNDEDEIPFMYYVGVKKHKLFKSRLSRTTGYGKWVRLVNAQINEFEIYYSSLPMALSGNLSITDDSVKKKNLKIDIVSDNENVSIYIRASKPSAIEYCVADKSEIDEEKYIMQPVSVDLM